MRIDLKCPAEMLGAELPTEESPFVLLTLMDLTDRGIVSCEATVKLLDRDGQVKVRTVHRARALEGRPHSTFSMAVPMEPAEGAEEAEVTLDKVWFEDNDIWRRNPSEETEYEPNALPPGNDLNALRYTAGPAAVGFPSQQAAVWVCVCGRANGNGQSRCVRCRREKEAIFRQYNRNAVLRAVSQRERQLDLKTRGAREESAQMQRVREEIWNRAQARKKRRIRLAAACGAAVILWAGAETAGVPAAKLWAADRAMQEDRLESAETMLSELGSFPGAERRLAETRIRIARRDGNLAAAGGLTESTDGELASLSAKLREEGTEPGDRTLADRVDLVRAERLLKAGREGEAEPLLQRLPEETEGREILLRDCAWARAEKLFAEKDYEAARAVFLSLGEYPGAETRSLDCLYEPALDLTEAGAYDEAIALLEKIPDYQDSREQIRRNWYLKGVTLEAGGEQEEARQAYLTAGAYEDAAERARAIRWAQAETLLAAQDYEGARLIYRELDGDGNAREKWILCATEAARKAYRARDYLRVIEILEDLPENTAETNRFRTRALYLGSKAVAQEGNLEEAIAMMERISDYGDASRTIRSWRMTLAQARMEEGRYAEAREILLPVQEHYQVKKLMDQIESAMAEAEAEPEERREDEPAADEGSGGHEKEP